MKSITPRVAIFLFGSGLAALVYQTAWERMLRLVFGASTGASSAVLAIFLGGLGLGGAWLGKRAEAAERPLLLYGNLEIGVALFASITPFLVDVAAHLLGVGWRQRPRLDRRDRGALAPVRGGAGAGGRSHGRHVAGGGARRGEGG